MFSGFFTGEEEAIEIRLVDGFESEPSTLICATTSASVAFAVSNVNSSVAPAPPLAAAFVILKEIVPESDVNCSFSLPDLSPY